MLANMVCSLIKHRRIQTTLSKAKVARSVAEKMVTLGKSGTLHDRRLASARLFQDEEAVKELFNVIAPTQKDRRGGYTRIIRLQQRRGDAAETAILEFVDVPVSEPTQPVKATTEAKPVTEPKAPEAKPEAKTEAKEEAKAVAKPA
jgi:large subunit ribosomal protein L17